MVCTTSPCPVPHERSKRGGRSLHHLPLQCGATRRRARRGRTGSAPHCALPRRIWRIRANPCPIRLSRQGPDHSSEGSPSEREALWWSIACATWRATWVHHPPFVAVSPIRRHEGDPRSLKSSIISRPLEAAVSASAWSILPTTASRPPWRSAVSQSASAMAFQNLAAGVSTAPVSRDAQGWRTRWVRSRWCLSQATAKTSTVRLALQPAG